VISLVRYLWRSCTKFLWCCPVAVAVVVTVTVAVAVAVAVTSGASSSDAPILVPSLWLLSWCQFYGVA
jgi:hypothetical protein